MKFKSKIFSFYFLILLVLISGLDAYAQNVKRVVLIKTDGLSGDLVDKYVKERDPATGKSLLPWFEEIFYKNGTRLENFYVRGMSLSGPSWTLLDTGHHLQVKGNVEYDRYTLHAYDYLNFFPFWMDYGLGKVADMPAVEVMNQLKLPLLSDSFDYSKRYTSPQLLQRGNDWKVFGNSVIKFYPRDPNEFISEWILGFEYRNMIATQSEKDIIYKLNNRPYIEYYDFYDADVDHVAHNNRDRKTQYAALQKLDLTLGRIWTGMQTAPGVNDTALILVSDHGFNSDEKIYSQGFNIVHLLAGANGGAHHVITKRRLMLDYSVKGIYPLVPLITTESKESFYLKGQQDEYPTALVDFDGNERTAFHLRNSDLNVLHLLFQQLKKGKLSGQTKTASTDLFFEIIEKRRAEWTKISTELTEEMDALHRWIEAQQKIIAAFPKTYTPEEFERGQNRDDRRTFAQTNIAIREEAEYREYLRVLNNLLTLKKETFNAKKLKIEDYIGKGNMGENNSVYQMQNYVAGISPNGLTLDESGKIDFEKSFRQINYFELLKNQAVRNNVQEGISSRPVDFTTVRIPLETIEAQLPEDLKPDDAPIWLSGGNGKQGLLLTRKDEKGNQSYRYLPITNLQQDADGKYSYQINGWSEGFPLKIFEDEKFAVSGDRKAWLDQWHSEDEWFNATHKTFYSNAIIGLNEQMDQHPFVYSKDGNETPDEKLISRFRLRQRFLVSTDILVLANNHWNFDVRGFNPGGNHGSFFRVSTNSTLMMAGGENTNIPKGLTVTKPYDSLSFVPTVLYMTGKADADGNPSPELYEKGFRKFPGKIIREIADPQK